jgi:hypothetical protein
MKEPPQHNSNKKEKTNCYIVIHGGILKKIALLKQDLFKYFTSLSTNNSCRCVFLFFRRLCICVSNSGWSGVLDPNAFCAMLYKVFVDVEYFFPFFLQFGRGCVLLRFVGRILASLSSTDAGICVLELSVGPKT